MPTITITRSSEYVNKLRFIDIKLNGKKIGNVGDGEVKMFEVPEGDHTIKATIDWCGSPELQLSLKGDDDEVFFHLSSFQKIQKYILYMMVVAVVTLILFVFLHYAILMYVTVGMWAAILLFIVFMLTINRNRYLTLVRQ